MNRRDFLKVLAAAFAAPILQPAEALTKLDIPKLKVVPGPARLAYAGFTFERDPSPMRFILMPISNEFMRVDPQQGEFTQDCGGYPWIIPASKDDPQARPNPEWDKATHQLHDWSFNSDVFRKK